MDQPEDVKNGDVQTEATSLHRSVTKKVFGGVAGGISERFDVDANIVRVVFVVLALVYGLGVAIYLAMWVLIPRSPTSCIDEVVPVEEVNHARARWLKYALPLGVVVLVVIFFTTIHGVPRFGKGLALLWLIFLVVLAIASLSSPARRLTFRRFLALAFLAFLSLLILVTGSFLLVVQVIGVPLKGGSGVQEWRPTTTAEVQHDYHGAFGQSTIDLRNVPFTPGTWSITATQGVGTLIVDIPPNVTVDLRTHVGIGTVQNNQLYIARVPATTSTSRARKTNLDLNLQVGVGVIELFHYFR
jgi:phage shock protein PspC (stress-responsive transcriptional regulator)